MMAPQLEPQVVLQNGTMGRTYICLTDGMQVGAMHLDVVVVAPIQARTPAEPITREEGVTFVGFINPLTR